MEIIPRSGMVPQTRVRPVAGRGTPGPSGRPVGRPPVAGYCTVCGTRVPRSRAVVHLPGAFLCPACARATPHPLSSSPSGERSLPEKPEGRRLREGLLSRSLTEEEEGMIRKNLTITTDQDEFLARHREINQSALFRRAVLMLMEAESGPPARSKRSSR